MPSIVTTCTRDCPNTCGLLATVENGRVTALRGNPEHPVSRGFACRKCRDFVARASDPERILTPLRRRGDAWTAIGWEEALDEIAERMLAIRAQHGPEAILYYRGFAQRTALKLIGERFFNRFGGVTGLSGTLCGGTGQASQDLDFGNRISHEHLDYLNSRCLILWGRNPVVTGPTLARIATDLRRRGDTVVLIDPVASESRSLADLFIQPKPGSDAYLAMATAKWILQEGLEDRDFIENHSEGFAGYRQILDSFSLNELCRRCDVPLEQITALAELLCRRQPAGIALGWGMHRYRHAHLALRTIDALGAIAGNIGLSGGGVSQGFDEYAPFDMELTGDAWHPERRRLPMPRIGADILAASDPGIEMIFVTAGNPVAMAPNAALVQQAFEQTPFVVVAGLFLDDTARTADLFLPTTTFLEEDDFVGSFGHSYVGPVNRAVAPPGQCRSDFDIFRALAQRFDFAEEFRQSAEAWQQRLLAPVLAQGLELADLRRGPVRLANVPAVPYRDRRFPTPSGKFRFLREFDAPPAAAPDNGHPLHLLSISPPQWLCSEMTPADQKQPMEIRLHPDTAATAGLSDGTLAWVENARGRVCGRVKLAEGERRDTLVFPRGKWSDSGSSVNLLTEDGVSQVGNGATYYDTRVRIYPAKDNL